jgi:predicted nucleic acid-binding protein
MSCTFDTNILVYTLGEPADVKHQRAQSLIIRGARRQTAMLLLQSLAEFSYVATRKIGVSVASVRLRVNGWCGGFPVHPAVGHERLASGLRTGRDRRRPTSGWKPGGATTS